MSALSTEVGSNGRGAMFRPFLLMAVPDHEPVSSHLAWVQNKGHLRGWLVCERGGNQSSIAFGKYCIRSLEVSSLQSMLTKLRDISDKDHLMALRDGRMKEVFEGLGSFASQRNSGLSGPSP